MNKEEKLNHIIERMMEVGPMLKRSLIHHDVENDLTKAHFPVLHILHRYGSMSMTDIGKKLHTSKPHTTILGDKLFKEGLVERVTSDADRRVINLQLTAKGKKFIQERLKQVSAGMRDKLSALAAADLDVLHDSLGKIKSIINKLN